MKLTDLCPRKSVLGEGALVQLKSQGKVFLQQSETTTLQLH